MQLNLEEGKVNEVAYYLRDTGGENFVLVHFVRSRQSKISKCSYYASESLVLVLPGYNIKSILRLGASHGRPD